MTGWHSRAYKELDENLEDGVITHKEYKEGVRELEAEIQDMNKRFDPDKRTM